MSNSLVIDVPNVVKQNTPLRNVPSGSTATPDYSVKYVPQSLTEEQQAQARQNIGAAAAGEGGGTTVNEFHYLRDTTTDPATFYIDANGYEPKEGDLMTIVWDWPFRTNENEEVAFKNPATLKNNTTNPSIYVKNAHQMATDYDEIDPEVNTRWTVRLEKVNDVWYAYNISTAVQADWTTVDTHAPSYIKNKPAISEEVILEDLPSAITIYCQSSNTLRIASVGSIDTPTDLFSNGIYIGTYSGNGSQDIPLQKGKNVFVATNRSYSYLSIHNFSIVNMTYPVWMYINMAHYAVIQYTESQPNLFCVIKDATDDRVWMMKSGSTYYMMKNNLAQNFMSDGANKIIFTDYAIPTVSDLASSSVVSTLYVPNVRKTEFMTMLNNNYSPSDVEIALTHVQFYDFLILNPDYSINMITLPTLALTMTDANNNNISGDFVAQNITIS